MGFFDRLFGTKQSGIEIGAPLAGRCVPLSEVPDPTFADEILGPGAAIIPTDGHIYAPASGTITTLFPTGHAVAITTGQGVEVLIHIGLDTVGLKGSAFTILASEGQTVKQGDLLIEADLEAISAAGLNPITPVLICNADQFQSVSPVTGQTVAPGDTILRLK